MNALLLALFIALQLGPPSQEFEKGRYAFNRGEYARAIRILRPLLYPEPRLGTEAQIVQTHRMLGFAYVYQNETEEAKQEFRRLLQLRPGYRLDPLLDPPEVVDFFNEVVKQQEKELAELEARRRDAEAEERRRLEAARAGPVIVEKRIARNSYAVNLIPLGAGQFQNGQRRKGWAFLAGEGVLGAVSLGAFVTNFVVYGARPSVSCVPSATSTGQAAGCPPGQVPGPEEGRSRLLLRVQVVSGALFFATAAWGIVDAILNFRPEVPLAATPPRSSLTFAPALLGPEAVGGTLGFRF